MSITWEKLQSQYAAALDEACEINDYYDAAAADEARTRGAACERAYDEASAMMEAAGHGQAQ